MSSPADIERAALSARDAADFEAQAAWAASQKKEAYARLASFNEPLMREDWHRAMTQSRSLASEGRYEQALAWSAYAAQIKNVCDCWARFRMEAAAVKAAPMPAAKQEHRGQASRAYTQCQTDLVALPLREPCGSYASDYRPRHGVRAFEYQGVKAVGHGGKAVTMPTLLTRAEWKEMALAKTIARRQRTPHVYIDEAVAVNAE